MSSKHFVSVSQWDMLVEIAKNAAQKAYCPYSKFKVGAALLTTNGNTYAGCNVENASYGLTICAERNAIFQMVYHGETEIAGIAIYTPTNTPSMPCGGCRQVINEFCGKERHLLDVLSACDSGQMIKSLTELLPYDFGPHNLV